MLIKVRTLTGKEIELDIEPDYKVCLLCPSATLGLKSTLRLRKTTRWRDLLDIWLMMFARRSRRSRRRSRRKRVSHRFSNVWYLAESRCTFLPLLYLYLFTRLSLAQA